MGHANLTTKLAGGAAALSVAAYFAAGFLGRAGATPWSPSEATQQVLARTFPQQWPFFTKSPLEPNVRLYHHDSAAGWSRQDLDRGLRLGNAIGLRRTSRVTGRELSLIAGELLPFEWFSCAEEVSTCLDAPPVTATVDEPLLEYPELCGEFAIVMQGHKPWAWRDDDVAMPSKFAKFEIVCS
jgi:antimicrobial peptide system SdpA family protein